LPVLPEAPAEVEAEPVLPEPSDPEVLAEPVEPLRRPETAVFGGQLLGETSGPSDAGASKSRTGMYVGMAAALVVFAGVAWYSQQPRNAISGLLGGSSAAHSAATTSEAPSSAAPASHPEVSSAAPANSGAAPSETAPESSTSSPTFSH